MARLEKTQQLFMEKVIPKEVRGTDRSGDNSRQNTANYLGFFDALSRQTTKSGLETS